MKIFLVIVVIGIALFGGIFMFNNGDPVLGTHGENDTEDVFMLVALKSQVFMKAPGESSFMEIKEPVSVVEGAEIKTSPSGKAALLHPNGTITDISPDSEVVAKV